MRLESWPTPWLQPMGDCEAEGPLVDWIMSPQNPHVKAPTPSVTIFGDRAHKEVIKVKRVYKVGGLNPTGLMSLKEEEEIPERTPPPPQTHMRSEWRPCVNTAERLLPLKDRKRGLTRNSMWILDFQPPELRENKRLLFMPHPHPSLWYSVMADLVP